MKDYSPLFSILENNPTNEQIVYILLHLHDINHDSALTWAYKLKDSKEKVISTFSLSVILKNHLDSNDQVHQPS